MREVMKWSKNYLTNELVTKNVMKDSDSLIGRATIKVIDSKGNLKQEVVSDNIIHPSTSDFTYYHTAFKELTGGFNSQYHYDIMPFKKLILSTDSNEESESNITISGDTIGYGVVNDSSSTTDKLKGIFDQINSFTERTSDGFLHRHCVFEFGNAKANGTFNSVLFTYSNMNNNYTRKTTPPFRIRRLPSVKGLFNETTYGSNGSNAIPADACYLHKGADGKFYIKDNSKYNEVLNLERWINGLEPIKKALNPNENFVYYALSTSDKKYVKIENIKATSHKQGLETTYDLNIYNLNHELVETINMSNISNLIPDLQKYIDSYTSSSSSYNVTVTPDTHIMGSNGDCIIIFNIYSGSGSHSVFPAWDSSNKVINPNSQSYQIYAAGIYNIYSKKWVVKPSVDGEDSRCFAEIIKYNLSSSYSFCERYTRITVNGNDYYVLFSDGSVQPQADYIYQWVDGKLKINCVDEVLTRDYYYSSNGRNYGIAGMLEGYDNIVLGYYSYHNNVSNGQSAYLGVGQIVGHNSHTKLPSPVTKTEDDTMKIEYDYYIQIPNLLGKNGDHTQMPD